MTWRPAAKLTDAAWALLDAIGVQSAWLASHIPALHASGWIRSRAENRCVDQSGRPVPWITYPARAFLERRVRDDMDVFEYGCGASTLWWASRVRRIVSVEHDEAWSRAVSVQAPPNATVLHVPLTSDGRYSREALAQGGKFHVVVIDGRDRVRCAAAAPGALRPDGVILFDNSDRPTYGEAYRALADAGFRRLDFVGLAPMIGHQSETSVYYRDENCLGI